MRVGDVINIATPDSHRPRRRSLAFRTCVTYLRHAHAFKTVKEFPAFFGTSVGRKCASRVFAGNSKLTSRSFGSPVASRSWKLIGIPNSPDLDFRARYVCEDRAEEIAEYA